MLRTCGRLLAASTSGKASVLQQGVLRYMQVRWRCTRPMRADKRETASTTGHRREQGRARSGSRSLSKERLVR